MNSKIKGYACGIIAAISYGTNPLGALNLYKAGLNPDTVIFFRYAIATCIVASILLVRRKSFAITRKELSILALIGTLFSISSLTLFMSFNYMDAGIASTILFVYPVMVAVIMAIFFKEKVSLVTVLSIALAFSGIALLYKGEGEMTLSATGVLLVIASSLTYALYIVIVNKSSLVMSAVKLSFYVMLFGLFTIIVHSLSSPANHIQMLTTPEMWLWASMLALLPTVISLVLMVIAINNIGSTPAAIMGALEPITAVIIGVTVFGEAFTPRLATGIVMILVAVILIIVGKSMYPSTFFTTIIHKGKEFKKHLRWKI